ncbi:MAG: DUF1295 domain-containing protein [Chloroflexi bacterium]|nr:DUF1295 domain-containing protein [Chloroflexota bacterium]
MAYTVLGTVALLANFLLDIVALRGIRYWKLLIEILTTVVFCFAVWMAALQSSTETMSAVRTAIGIALLVTAIVLLAYSLFWEIPFRSTYLRDGVGDQLVTTGTYALCRHPEVLWSGLLFLAVYCMSGGWLFLTSAILWLAILVLRVYVMERVYLVPVFGDAYRKYQQQTPMLIPNAQSVRRCVQSFRKG